jgi:hypothetical protein
LLVHQPFANAFNENSKLPPAGRKNILCYNLAQVVNTIIIIKKINRNT